MRVGELCDLEWRDVDLVESGFRIRKGKTATARRWVSVPVLLMEAIRGGVPARRPHAERRVFPGFPPDTARSVVARACKAAGIAHFHPHDLRHRYASVKIAEGVRSRNGRAARAREELAHARRVRPRSHALERRRGALVWPGASLVAL
jgi:integrase